VRVTVIEAVPPSVTLTVGAPNCRAPAGAMAIPRTVVATPIGPTSVAVPVARLIA
jgi:hypothetical protein